MSEPITVTMPPGWGLSVKYRLTVRRADGSLKSDTQWRRSESLLKQWMQHLRVQYMDATDTAVKDTGGTDRTLITPSGNYLNAAAGTAGVATYGIVLGLNGNAVAATDYQLGSQAAEGTGANQIVHGATSVATPTVTDRVEFAITREFTNNSGGDITIVEMGVYVATEDSGGTDRAFCVIRDVLTTTDFGAGDVVTAQYNIIAEVPWVKQWGEHLRGAFARVNQTGVEDTGDTGRTIRFPGSGAGQLWMELTAPAGNSGYGLTVGTGSAAEITDRSNLQTPIAEGTGAGQLSYQATAVSAISSTAAATTVTVTRNVVNNSGGDIIITEVGVVGKTDVTDNLEYNFLIARKVLDTPVTIVDGATKVIRVVFSEAA